MISDNAREAARDRMYKRHHGCDKCTATWSARKVLGKDLPLSAQDGAFPDQRYDYCGACGNLRMRRGK